MTITNEHRRDTTFLLKKLLEKIETGHSCLPLIGAGFSAPSGAPLVTDLREYLQGCICASLGMFEESHMQEGGLQTWHPRTDAWPMPISQMQIHRGFWEDKLFGYITNLRGEAFSLRQGDVSKKGQYRDAARKLRLYSEALGAMQDWRTSLLFLSRLTSNSLDPVEPCLSAPRAEVVDRFFREVMAGKRPSLGHRMLGALAPSLGIDIVLTTNFDDLLEKGFATAGVDLNVFEVPSRGQLPELAAITSGDTLIKLHGGRTSLRADYSLDEVPTTIEDATFISYLKSAHTHLAKKYLLVIGFSGDDERIRHFVEEAMKHLKKNAPSNGNDDPGSVYWLCYTSEDEQQLVKHFSEQIEELCLVPIRSTRTDFFLLELYQALHQALPPLVGVFPSVPRTALPWRIPGNYLVEVNKTIGPEFGMQLSAAIDGIDQPEGVRTVVVCGDEASRGLSSLCTKEFERNEGEQGRIPLWLDLNDISSALNLFEVLLEAVHFKLGIEDWVPSATARGIDPSASFSGQAKELNRVLGTTKKRWIIFLNARETPGANIYEPAHNFRMPPNGWLDWRNVGPSDWPEDWHRENSETASFDGFISLINALHDRCSNVTIVVLCNSDPHVPLLVSNSLLLCPCHVIDYKPSLGAKTGVSVLADCIEWIGDDPAKKQFVQILSLMQRPRFPAAIWSDAFWPDEPPGEGLSTTQRAGQIKDWTGDLERIGLVRIKPGGMVTLVTSCRSSIRKSLCNPDTGIAKAHYRLGIWYDSLLDSSGAAAALFETLYHFCKSAEVSVEFLMRDQADHETLLEGPEKCINRAAKAVEAAASKISSESYLIQTHGQSRGSCRQLERLCDIGERILEGIDHFKKGQAYLESHHSNIKVQTAIVRLSVAIPRLWLASTEAMRSIAREVGEDGKAYQRQRQVGYLLIGKQWKDAKTLSALKLRPTTKANSFSLTTEVNASKHSDATKRRWVRWNVMLAAASRSYQQIENTLHGSKSILGARSEFTSEPRYEKIPLEDQQERLEILRLIEEAVQVHLLKFSLQRRLMNDDNAVELKVMFRDIDALVLRGLRLASKIKVAGSTQDSSEFKTAVWAESRLLMHLSVVHARAGEVGYRPRVERNPLGILANAESRLSNVSPSRFRSEKALTDLHRAEVRLRAVEVRAVQQLLSKWREGELPDLESLGRASAKARVAVAQAVAYLDSSEPVLRERRRNVWWTTWYCERKLKSIALSVLMSASSRGEVIPFLGLEAAMRDTETEADRLLGEASRMIRIDAYRLATILDAYVDCYFALVAKLKFDDSPPRMPIRLRLMRVRIKETSELLETIYLARKTYPVSGSDLDPAVAKYIDSVLHRASVDREHSEFAKALIESMEKLKV